MLTREGARPGIVLPVQKEDEKLRCDSMGELA
jgi:hypothetical protein